MNDFVKKSAKMTKIIKKKAKGLRGMAKRGVYHNPKEKPRYYSYMNDVPSKALKKKTVVLDEATGVYWDWKKEEGEETSPDGGTSLFCVVWERAGQN